MSLVSINLDQSPIELKEARLLFDARVLSKLTFVGVLLFAIGSCCNAVAQGSIEEGRNALSKKAYPWYDVDNDGVRRVDFQPRPDSRSVNRNEIPVYQPTESEPWDWGDWNWNWGGKFRGAPGGAGAANGVGALVWAALITLILIVVGILIWAVSQMDSNPLPDEIAPKRSVEESIKHLPFELESSGGDFRERSQAAYKNGDYRKAITYLFSHVLVSLDQKGLIRLRKGKTNRQYLRELRSYRPLANYYQRVMVSFEATFFGDHEIGQGEFESCWNQLDQFQSGVESTSQVANV